MSARTLPNVPEAERSLLGGILLSPRALAEVADVVEPRDFYHPAHEAIFAAMLALDRAGRPVDGITVGEQMTASDTVHRLRAFGGPESYAAGLMSDCVTIDNIRFHARLIRSASTLRELAEAGERIAALGRAGQPSEAEEAVSAAEAAVFQIAQRREAGRLEHIRPILARATKALEARYESGEAITGVPSGFAALDRYTLGFQPGDLIIIAARPGIGKTALAMNAVLNAALDHAVPGLVFSLEMSKEALLERALCGEARIDSMAFRTGMLRQIDWLSLTKAASRISEAPIWIDDQGAPTLTEIRSKARRWRADAAAFPNGGLGVIVVDYLQLIRPDATAPSREREIAEISAGLKALAKELRIPVIALSQLNRSVEARGDKRPQLSDLRESGAIEQDSDLICFIYRDEFYHPETKEPGIAEVVIGKQRNGPTGVAKLGFESRFTKFYPLRESD